MNFTLLSLDYLNWNLNVGFYILLLFSKASLTYDDYMCILLNSLQSGTN